MKKYRFYTNFDKEERWLDNMAKNGWAFTSRSIWGTYYFDKIEPSNINYRIDFRIFGKKEDFAEYVQIFADSGWKHISGSKYSGSQYFTPNIPNVDEDIFSDGNSKAGRYGRLSIMWLSIIIAYTIIFLISLGRGSVSFYSLFNPKEWYLTPGLWEKVGSDFWKAFCFETPFAVMRGTSWIIYLGIFIASIYFMIRCLYESKKFKAESTDRR